MPSYGSVISFRVRRGSAFIAILTLSLCLLSGCPKGPALLSLPPAVDRQVTQKGDLLLRNALLQNSPFPFAIVARFKAPVFPYQTELLADAGIPPVETVGSTALLVATAGEITALFEAPSLLGIRYLGNQASLVRLHPAVEIEILRAFETRTESAPINFLIRFDSPPEERETRSVVAAGFVIETRNGPTWTVKGTIENLPALLTLDEIIYIEIASKARKM